METFASTAATQVLYESKAKALLDRYLRETGFHWQDDALALCAWLAGLRPVLSRSTWRVYKASMIHFMRSHGPIEAVEYLERQGSEPCLRQTRRTSASKEKRLPPGDLASLLDALLPGAHRYDRLIGLWLLSGKITGLRPSEWREAFVEGDILIVKNGKHNDHRACGPYRRLHLEPKGDRSREIVEEFLDELHAFDYDEAYEGCRQRLYHLARRLWPRRARYPTLYSARHQFSADAKAAGLDKISVAALMGHRSEETAGLHYGRKRHGQDGLHVAPDPENMALVVPWRDRVDHTNASEKVEK